MEILLMVGVAIKGIVTSGYVLAGGYGVATIAKYVKDYKEYNSKELG